VRATRANQFVVRAQHLWFGTSNNVSNPTGHFLTTSTGAHLTTGGAWTNSSDAARKEAFEAVDAEQVLERLARLPIRSWRYREEAGARHLGPTAQDFRAAFGLGGSETAIATVDADGVAMLAIQALERRTRELREEARRAEALDQRVAELEAGNAQLLRRLERLEAASR
jgi:trimeric autotransporter adhesin